MLFACLHIRLPRCLRHPRCLADPLLTVTRLPSHPMPAPTPAPLPTTTALPTGFVPAFAAPAAPGPDVNEARVRAWLHYNQYGRSDTVTSSDDRGRQR
ncbi:hypothetical protein [Streptomyces sp. ITFR-6]|uniref:hypothetical protein n=1 Tax=Streptomyces sp. ITFR-6 TaxID=3075197 RepID=UPI00288917C3|nr:hypothetical protein [Streptomyces sp. ITFR-6]WNI34400.1 hypothetical protein RLT59_37920 [Streptomyces sp. ITFR-6]